VPIRKNSQLGLRMREKNKTNKVMKSRGRRLAFVLALSFGLACQTATAQAVSPSADLAVAEAEQTLFTKGQRLYNQGLYGEAIAALNELLTAYPRSSIKDLSLLWLGRSYLGQGNISDAEKIELQLRNIPNTELIGLYEEELRIARQSYAKAAAPGQSQRSEVALAPVRSRSIAPDIDSQSEPAPKPVAALALKLPSLDDSKSTAQITTMPPPPVRTLSSAPVLVPAAVKSEAIAPRRSEQVISAKLEKRSAVVSQAKALPAVETQVAEPVQVLPKALTTPALLSRVEAVPGSAVGAEVSYRLVMINEGDGAASDLTIRLELDRSLIYVGSDLLPIRQELLGQRQVLTFKLPLVEAGQTRTLQISVKPGQASAASITPKHSIFYKDSRGTFHHTP
jgi:hypothetical protein